MLLKVNTSYILPFNFTLYWVLSMKRGSFKNKYHSNIIIIMIFILNRWDKECPYYYFTNISNIITLVGGLNYHE